MDRTTLYFGLWIVDGHSGCLPYLPAGYDLRPPWMYFELRRLLP
jgi:hypothetical protein